MDAVRYFKWNRAADILAPLLFESLDSGDRSSVFSVEIRKDDGCGTFAKWTPEGLSANIAFEEGWIYVWEGNVQLKGDKAQQELYKRSSVSISFTGKGITDIAALLYGYDEVSQQ